MTHELFAACFCGLFAFCIGGLTGALIASRLDRRRRK